MLNPQRLNLGLLCSLNNGSILRSIQLQQCNEGVVSSLQRFGDCYLIYCCNEQLLDAHTYPHRLTDPGSAAGCLSEGYESYSNDKITCCHPPVCNVDGRSQVRKITEQGRGNSPAPLSPSAHHSLTPSFLCFNCFSFISLLLSVFLPWIFSRDVFLSI